LLLQFKQAWCSTAHASGTCSMVASAQHTQAAWSACVFVQVLPSCWVVCRRSR
jgi:hypothetical protein